MSERIYQAITEDFIRRMRNWAKAGAGLLRSGGGPISSIYAGGVRIDRYVSTEPPLLNGEADDTDAALLVVPIRYRQAVQQFWRYEGQSLRWQARRLRLGMKHHTFEDWVIRGHKLLQTELAVRSAVYHARAMANQAAAVSNST